MRIMNVPGRLAVAILVTAAALTACGQKEAVGGDPGTWTPLSITTADNGSTIDMVVGQVALFDGLPMNNGEDLNFIADPTGIVTIERAEGDPDGVSAGPALIAKAPGTTTLTISYDEDNQVVMAITVNVTE